MIKIFTISGELVNKIDHNNENSGYEWWDLRTINNQEAAPGLYIYHIQQMDPYNNSQMQELVGKFAIVR